ncbi:multicopper oxidase, partial [Plectosphaerella plurivora]
MDRSRSARDEGGENEPMLGAVGRPSFDSQNDDSLDSPRRNSLEGIGAGDKPSKGPRLFRIVAILCGVTIIVLSSFIFLNFFRAQQHPSEPQQHGGSAHAHGGGDEHMAPATTAAPEAVVITTSTTTSAAPSTTSSEAPAPTVVSPQDQLNLKTGFKVSSEPEVREFVFNITREIAAPDGYEKPVIRVNGQSPGPIIEANTGDTIRVFVNNQMPTESTTIHWHGIDQRNTTWMDGVHGISQCGIPPGESFTYEFTITNQRGTFWYHSHLAVQYTDGLFGPLIIHDPTEKVPKVDDEKILMIGDLHHRYGSELLADYLGSAPPWSPDMPSLEPPPDNLVFNGMHVSNCSASTEMDHDGMEGMEHGSSGMQGMNHGSSGIKGTDHVHGSRALGACAAGSLYSTRVKSNSLVRFRVISHSANAPYYFSIDNHTFEITEIDGTEISPLTTTRLFMNPGQRYSITLNANQTAGNYLMRAAAASHCFHLPGHMHRQKGHGDTGLANIDFEATAILSYDDTDATVEPLGSPWDTTRRIIPGGRGAEPWRGKCHDIPFDIPKPLRPADAYEVTNYHYFKYKTGYSGKTWRTFINQTLATPLESDATLWQATQPANTTSHPVHSTQGHERDLPDQRLLISQDPNNGAQIVINSMHMMSHPWHLHGQNFQVVGWGSDLFGKGKTTWNFDNPLRRDTVTVPGDSHVVIRILGDNPGVWALHCHILWHAEGGMGLAIAQRMDQLRTMIDELDKKEGATSVRNKFCAAGTSRPTLPPGQ